MGMYRNTCTACGKHFDTSNKLDFMCSSCRAFVVKKRHKEHVDSLMSEIAAEKAKHEKLLEDHKHMQGCQEANLAGTAAFLDGKKPKDNPYNHELAFRECWILGYEAAQTEEKLRTENQDLHTKIVLLKQTLEKIKNEELMACKELEPDGKFDCLTCGECECSGSIAALALEAERALERE